MLPHSATRRGGRWLEKGLDSSGGVCIWCARTRCKCLSSPWLGFGGAPHGLLLPLPPRPEFWVPLVAHLLATTLASAGNNQVPFSWGVGTEALLIPPVQPRDAIPRSVRSKFDGPVWMKKVSRGALQRSCGSAALRLPPRKTVAGRKERM
ncbi:hypothetical protein AOLI_G00291290 [Acnodon oligacanthus]